VSQDGRFVAAGTGPTGLVFLFSTRTGKIVPHVEPRRLDHPHHQLFSRLEATGQLLRPDESKSGKLPAEAEPAKPDEPALKKQTRSEALFIHARHEELLDALPDGCQNSVEYVRDNAIHHSWHRHRTLRHGFTGEDSQSAAGCRVLVR